MDEFLQMHVALRQGPLALDARFALSSPWSCLFGASGSGKSTLLRALAGFVRPDHGRIVLRSRKTLFIEEVLFDSGSGVYVLPHQRPTRMAAQQAWLFPGTVRGNVGYGVMAREHAKWVESVLERLHLAELAETDVRRLSGGERQRVSVARAVAAAAFGDREVRLLLLDEPFAGMDMALRDRLAIELHEWLGEMRIPVLSVTHDVGEAFLLDAEVIRLVNGKVVAQGPVAEVLREERRRLRAVLDADSHER